jgi:hypothetical protein
MLTLMQINQLIADSAFDGINWQEQEGRSDGAAPFQLIGLRIEGKSCNISLTFVAYTGARATLFGNPR